MRKRLPPINARCRATDRVDLFCTSCWVMDSCRWATSPTYTLGDDGISPDLIGAVLGFWTGIVIGSLRMWKMYPKNRPRAVPALGTIHRSTTAYWQLSDLDSGAFSGCMIARAAHELRSDDPAVRVYGMTVS